MLANLLTFWGFLSGGQGGFPCLLELAVMKTVNRLAPGDGFEQLPALFIGLTPWLVSTLIQSEIRRAVTHIFQV